MLPPSEVIDFGQALEDDVLAGVTADVLDVVGIYFGEDSFQEVLTSVVSDWARTAATSGAIYSEQAHASVLGPAVVDALAPYIPDSVFTNIIQGATREGGVLDKTFLIGRIARLVHSRFRETVENYCRTTPGVAGYARKTRPGCCAFCAMLSMNVYGSKRSAVSVKGDLGRKYHDFCKCSAVPLYGGTVGLKDDITRLNGESAATAYEQAVKGGANGTTEILSSMREILDTK